MAPERTGGWSAVEGRPLLRLALSAVIGVALGAASRAADHLDGPLAWVGNLGWPWLAAAFLMGSLVRNRAFGALLGTVSLAAAVVSYYAAMFLLDYGMGLDGVVADGLPSFALLWVTVAVLGGPLFGAAGASWRGSQQALRLASVAVLAGALAGECVFWLSRGVGAADRILFVAGLLMAALLPVWLLRSAERWFGLALALGFTCVGLVALAVLGVIVRAGSG